MLETQLYFNFKDMFRAPRLALGRRMLVMLEALFGGYLVMLVFTYLALLIDGQSFGSIWADHHLLPPICLCGAGVLAKILLYLAYAVVFIFIYLGFTAVSKITIKEYKGDLFYSARDGWSWAVKHWFPVFFGPVSILIVIAFFLVLAAIFGWFAQWPVLDIIFYGLLFILFLPTAVFLAFSALSFLVSVIMSPSIVACAEEDTMGSMFGSYTLLWNQPLRFLTYLFIIIVISMLGYHIYGLFIFSGFKLLEMVFGHHWFMGEHFLAVKQVGVSLFGNYDFLPTYFDIPCCLDVVRESPDVSTGVTATITGVLIGIISLLGFLSIPAYTLATLATGLATEFIVLTKFKDDDDLIKRKDEDERAEEEESAEDDEGTPPVESEDQQSPEEPKSEGSDKEGSAD